MHRKQMQWSHLGEFKPIIRSGVALGGVCLMAAQCICLCVCVVEERTVSFHTQLNLWRPAVPVVLPLICGVIVSIAGHQRPMRQTPQGLPCSSVLYVSEHRSDHVFQKCWSNAANLTLSFSSSALFKITQLGLFLTSSNVQLCEN